MIDANVDADDQRAYGSIGKQRRCAAVAESRICMVFGVPPLIVYAYVGLLRATYAESQGGVGGFLGRDHHRQRLKSSATSGRGTC